MDSARSREVGGTGLGACHRQALGGSPCRSDRSCQRNRARLYVLDPPACCQAAGLTQNSQSVHLPCTFFWQASCPGREKRRLVSGDPWPKPCRLDGHRTLPDRQKGKRELPFLFSMLYGLSWRESGCRGPWRVDCSDAVPAPVPSRPGLLKIPFLRHVSVLAVPSVLAVLSAGAVEAIRLPKRRMRPCGAVLLTQYSRNVHKPAIPEVHACKFTAVDSKGSLLTFDD